MLHRSFKPAKCKTSLRLASSRIKLLKNKREAQLKQLKRELAQLLESGQDQTARIRVEHVVREEKTMAAYELLEIYCELIAARLPIIESQKNCPIDLKEAIASVIFASPRCADIPELMDVRKHFTAKYGKEFISAAVELRPDCGVSRMLVEKLSAKAPDGQTKLKILSAIAEEHNIKWDPESFGEKEFKPPDDLLNGPNTFEKASKMHTEPSIFQAHMSNVNATPSLDQKLSASANFEQNTRSSSSTQTFDSTDIGGGQTTMPAASHPGARPSGNGSERMEISHSESGDGNAFSFDRQNWNMKFKDATAAAQVAAESAERASMAARAAAELSIRGKITRKNSKESQEPNVHGLRDEWPGKNAASKLPSEHVTKDSGHNSSRDTNPQIQTQQVDGNEHDSPEELAERFYKLKNDLQKPDRYSQTSSFEEDATNAEKSVFFSETSMNKQAGGSEVEFVNGQQVGQHEHFNYFGEDSIRKQDSSVSALSNSRYNSFHDSNPQIKTKQADGSEHDDPEELAKRFYMYGQSSTKRSSLSASLDSSTALIDGDKLMNDLQNADIYSERSSFEEEAPKAEKSAFYSETSMNKQSTASAVEYMSGQQVGLQPEEFNYFGEERIRRKDSYDSFNYFGEERIRRKDSYDSSHPQSSNHDDYGISHFSHHKIGVDASENPFVSVDEENVHTDTVETSSYNNATVAFDESDSDDDDMRFDTQVGYHGQESNLYSTSPGRDSPAHLSVNRDTWSVSQNISESHGKSSLLSDVFSERHLPHEVDDSLTKPAHPSEPDDSSSLKFDDSEGPSSEGEEESDHRPGGKTDPSTLATKQNIYFRNPVHIQSENHWLTGSSSMASGDPGSNRKQDLHFPSDDEELVEVSAGNNQGMEFSKSPRKFGLDEASTSKSLSRRTNNPGSKPFYDPVEEGKSQQSPQFPRLQSVHEVKFTDSTCTPESPDIMKDDESGKELNLGTLTGGLRNKGYRRPPYIRRPLGDVSSSSKKAAEDSTTTIEQSTASPEVRSSLNFEVNTKVKNKSSSRTRTTFKDSDTDDSEEELPQQNSDSIQEPKPEPYNTKASAEINSKSRFRAPVIYFNSDDDDSEDPPTKQKLTGTGRVGTGFSRRTKATQSSGMGSSSKARISSGASLNSGTDVKKITSRSSNGSESPPKPKLQSQSQTRSVNSGRSGSFAEPSTTTSKPMPDSKISSIHIEDLKPSMKEQTSSPLKTLASGKTENPKASTSSGEAPPSRESSLKKAGHVHPKLPDYDTIAAQLQSYRLNRY